LPFNVIYSDELTGKQQPEDPKDASKKAATKTAAKKAATKRRFPPYNLNKFYQSYSYFLPFNVIYSDESTAEQQPANPEDEAVESDSEDLSLRLC